MKSHELDEWQVIDTPDFSMPDFSRGTHIGKIKTSEGEWDVLKLVIGGQVGFGLKSQTSNDIVCYVGIQEWATPYAMAKNAYTLPAFSKRGLATALVDFIVKQENYKLFSDFEMSKEGVALWKSIMSKSRSVLKIADLKGGCEYYPDDIGNQTPDGRTILDPEKDARPTPKYPDNIQNFEQQFVYILEEKQIIDYTNVKTTSKFGLPAYTPPGKGILQEYVYYGPNIDMD
jgi:hypothetical protein